MTAEERAALEDRLRMAATMCEGLTRWDGYDPQAPDDLRAALRLLLDEIERRGRELDALREANWKGSAMLNGATATLSEIAADGCVKDPNAPCGRCHPCYASRELASIQAVALDAPTELGQQASSHLGGRAALDAPAAPPEPHATRKRGVDRWR